MRKKLLSIVLIFMMCFTPMSAFAAENDSTQADSTGGISGKAVDMETGNAGDTLEAHIVTNGDADDIDAKKEYEISIPADSKVAVFPITFDGKGLFINTAEFSEEVPSRYLEENIYSDPECTKEIKFYSYDNKAVITKSGTYYVKFTVSDYSDDKPTDFYKVNFTAQFYYGEGRTLKNKTWLCTGCLDYNTSEYYKVVVAKTGALTINTETEADYEGQNVTLLNSKKKAISDEVHSYDGKFCYAVTKGTYYIKVRSDSEIYRIKATFTSAKDSGGATQKKALKLTKGKVYTGYLTATEKKGATDWYKITLTKSQKITIKFTGSVTSGKVRIEFFGGDISGSITDYICQVGEDRSFSPETWTSKSIPKGTYYIKVYKDSATSSGFYQIGLK